MSLAITATGTLLKVGDGASEEQFTTIPEMFRIQAPTVKFDMTDVTSHDSTGGFREYIPGLSDGENATGEFFYVPSNTVHGTVRDANINRTLKNFQIVFPDTDENELLFAAYAISFQPGANVGDVLRGNLTLKMTGPPDWS
jgi:predicted secreted protein